MLNPEKTLERIVVEIFATDRNHAQITPHKVLYEPAMTEVSGSLCNYKSILKETRTRRRCIKRLTDTRKKITVWSVFESRQTEYHWIVK